MHRFLSLEQYLLGFTVMVP
jgi:hypothetical protein